MTRIRIHPQYGLAILVRPHAPKNTTWTWLMLDPNNRRHPAGWADDEDVHTEGWRELVLVDPDDPGDHLALAAEYWDTAADKVEHSFVTDMATTLRAVAKARASS